MAESPFPRRVRTRFAAGGVGSQVGRSGIPLAPSTVNSYFYKVLHCPEPPLVTAGAITIGKRVVNVLYGHARPLSRLS